MDEAFWKEVREGHVRDVANKATMAMECGATPDQIVAALKSAGLEVVLVTPELRWLLDVSVDYHKWNYGTDENPRPDVMGFADDWAESAQGVAWREGAE